MSLLEAGDQGVAERASWAVLCFTGADPEMQARIRASTMMPPGLVGGIARVPTTKTLKYELVSSRLSNLKTHNYHQDF